MILDPVTLCAAAAAIVAGSFLQRVSGMGVGLVVSPALGFLLGPHIGIYATNIVTITSAVILTWIRWKDIDWKRAAWIIGWAIPGSILGALLVRQLATSWLQIIVGATILVAIALTFGARNLKHGDGPVHRIVAGVVGGACNTAVGVAAPAMVIYSRKSRWTQPSFGATLQPIFLFMGIFSVTSKTVTRAVDPAGLPAWWYLLIVIAMVLIGAGVGAVVAKKMSSESAQKIAITLATLGAVAVLVRGLLGL